MDDDVDIDDSLVIGVDWLKRAERKDRRPGILVMYAKSMVQNPRLFAEASTKRRFALVVRMFGLGAPTESGTIPFRVGKAALAQWRRPGYQVATLRPALAPDDVGVALTCRIPLGHEGMERKSHLEARVTVRARVRDRTRRHVLERAARRPSSLGELLVIEPWGSLAGWKGVKHVDDAYDELARLCEELGIPIPKPPPT
ncbi:MAG: hypothetical protein M3285_05755 [Actinomycetota bacterium]|nr:hypothetical protein [Actinomycetota bacterium]